MKIYAWNTGKHYTKHGQRIAWCELPNGKLAFVDADRGISGMIEKHPLSDIGTSTASNAYVYEEYLHNRYSYIPYEFYDIEKGLEQAARAI